MATHTTERLAIFLPALRGGGAEKMMLHLAQGFSERGFQVDLVLSKAVGPYLTQVPSSVRVVDLSAKRVLTSLFGLVSYLRRERPKALLSTTNQANLIAIWARSLARVSSRLVIREAITFLQSANRIGGVKKRITPFLMKVFYPMADEIIAISRGVSRELYSLRSIPSTKIHVVCNPVITDAMRDLYVAPVAHPWFSEDAPPVVIGVGRLHPQKDFQTLLRAFALVRQRLDARLVILGEGEQRDELVALTEKLDIAPFIQFPGFVETPYAYMKKSAVFVLSSAWEGFGNVLVEALAAGTPVVATDCPSGPAEILDNGKFGQLIPIGDHEAMAEAIITAIENKVDPESLIQRGMEYSAENAIDTYLRLLMAKNS